MTHRSTGGQVLVAGSANVDYVVRASHIAAPGETVLGGDLAVYPGGKGANQAVASARAGGAATRLLAAMGDDASAELLKRSIADAGVELDLVQSERPTGAALITVSDASENAITVAPGANMTLAAEPAPDLAGVGWLVMQLEIPLATVLGLAEAARRRRRAGRERSRTGCHRRAGGYGPSPPVAPRGAGRHRHLGRARLLRADGGRGAVATGFQGGVRRYHGRRRYVCRRAGGGAEPRGELGASASLGFGRRRAGDDPSRRAIEQSRRRRSRAIARRRGCASPCRRTCPLLLPDRLGPLR